MASGTALKPRNESQSQATADSAPRQPDPNYRTGSKRKSHKLKVYKTTDYEALPRERGAIRLLNLFPHGTTTSEVHCELITPKTKEDCKQKHEYEALSWCWGTDQKKASINIRSKGVHYEKKINPNLLAALQALRYPDRDRYLWIDAICINVGGNWSVPPIIVLISLRLSKRTPMKRTTKLR